MPTESTQQAVKFALAESTHDYYSRGLRLSDASVAAVIANAIATRALPKDTNGVLFRAVFVGC